MAHAHRNFKTARELKEAIREGETVRVYDPGGIFGAKQNGEEVIEGPWEIYKWYARVEVKNGRIMRVLS